MGLLTQQLVRAWRNHFQQVISLEPEIHSLFLYFLWLGQWRHLTPILSFHGALWEDTDKYLENQYSIFELTFRIGDILLHLLKFKQVVSFAVNQFPLLTKMNSSVYFKIAAATFPFIISILFGIRAISVFACSGEFESKCCKWLLFCVVSYFSFISLLFKVPRFLRLPESLKAEMLWVSSCVQ